MKLKVSKNYRGHYSGGYDEAQLERLRPYLNKEVTIERLVQISREANVPIAIDSTNSTDTVLVIAHPYSW